MCKYTQKPRVEQKICITQSGDITSEATDVGSRCAANLFAAAEACGICGCRKATVYLQIGCGQATETAMPRRYSICGKHSAAEYTKEPARCKLVCRSRCNASRLAIAEDSADEWAVRHTYISRQTAAGNRDCYAEALQYMRQAKRSRIYAEI